MSNGGNVMLTRFILCLFCLTVWAGSVAAQVCETIARAQELETQLLAEAGARPFDVRTLAALQINARAMSGYYVSDPRLAEAVSIYVTDVAAMRDNPAGHADPAHLGLLRYLAVASQSACTLPTVLPEPRTELFSSGRQAGARAWLVAADLRGAVPIVGFLVSILGFSTLIITVLLRRRQARLTRHHCLVDIEVATDKAAFPAKMVDISAKGAKIRLPEKAQLGRHITLNFNGKSYLGRLAWKNDNFAGIKFKRPLAGRLIRHMSRGIQREPAFLPLGSGRPRTAEN